MKPQVSKTVWVGVWVALTQKEGKGTLSPQNCCSLALKLVKLVVHFWAI